MAHKHVKPHSTRRASAQDIMRLLGESPMQVYLALAVEPADAHLSCPTDGKGARLCAIVRQARASTVPTSITVPLDGEPIEVPVEVSEAFSEFVPLRKKA